MSRPLRLARWLAFSVVMCAAFASAAQTPDVPSGNGLLRGRVLRESGAPLSEAVPVLLYALSESGEPGLREAQSSASGEFSFAGVSTDPGTIYLVGTKLGEVPYGTRASFVAGQTQLEVELRVAETRADASAARLGWLRIQLDWGCSGLRVAESVELRNPTSEVLYLPESARGSQPPILSLELPAGAEGFQGAIGSFEQGLEQVGSELRFWGPLHPGSRSLEFSYDLPAGERVHFERSFPRGAQRLSVLVHGSGAAPLAPGPGFRAAAEVTRAGSRYAAAETGAIAAGSRLAFELRAPARPEAKSRLALESAELWLELDDATLRADEAFALEVSGSEALAGDGAPLFCLDLPEGASDLRFSNEALGLGLAQDARGALALRGPLPAGRSELRIRYQLPVAGNPLRFARRFPLPLPLVRVLIADTGVVPETSRLHRLQTVSVSERSYAHLEGLSFAAGEELAIDLRRIQLGRGLPQGVSLALVGAGGLLALLYLAAALREVPSAAADPDAQEDVSGSAREREALFASIADLDHDFETGKLSAEDHARMHGELRSRVVATLRAERAAAVPARAAAAAAAAPTSRSATPGGRVCSACAEAVVPSARFCSHCGARLVEAESPPGAGGA